MDFQDVAFLPSLASFYTTFLKHCSIGECLWTATCLEKNMFWAKQSHAFCKIFSFLQILFRAYWPRSLESVSWYRDQWINPRCIGMLCPWAGLFIRIAPVDSFD